ncbi:MAG: hypothetical protein GY710_26620 [Desulfobacteraceae bacterium]|nr:hypothetical protein [Desulfobacteraceae bacterium]
MLLIFAEKPKTAKAIAKALGIPKLKTKALCYKNNDTVIIPAFGHLFELFMPEDYDKSLKEWTANSLPIIPDKFQIKLTDNPGVRRQYALMEKYYPKASEIIHAGDNDREGQYLIDEILDYLGNTKPVKRFFPQALSKQKVLKNFAKLEDNRKFINTTNAAMARTRSDWLIGLNITRAMSIAAREHGLDRILSGGRVQLIALTLVVDRDRAIESFVSINYFVPQITVKHPQGNFVAIWLPNKNHPLDSENRLIKKEYAQKIITGLKGQAGVIVSVSNSIKKKEPPLPYTQGTLLDAASTLYGLDVKKVAKITQSIYEAGLISYPRTNNPHLDIDEFDDGVKTLENLASHGNEAARKANPSIKSKTWKKAQSNDNKYAIIPTGDKPSTLTPDQKNIYNLIVERFIMQFYPPMQYASQQIITNVGGEQWKTSGTRVIEPGWTALKKKQDSTEKSLPKINEKDDITCLDAILQTKSTKPPARFTESKLIVAMENIDKFVPDPRVKAILRENAGIGTDGTRTEIVSLIKERTYIERIKGKGTQICSSKLGRFVKDIVPQALTDPSTSAMWDEFLNLIQDGEQTMEQFMEQTIAQLPGMVKAALNTKFPKELVGIVHKCPDCQSPIKRYKQKKKKGQYFWACYAEDKHHDGKPVFLPDEKGHPGQPYVRVDTTDLPHAECPEANCPDKMIQLESKKTPGFFYWKCKNKTHPIRFDNGGSPGDAMKVKKKKAS